MSRQQQMQELLQAQLKPSFLSIEDESNQHHAPKGAQTHFKLIAVSKHFEDLSRIERHRLVNQLLSHEFDQGLHALSMHLYTESEWASKKTPVQNSPTCKDGYKNKLPPSQS